MSTLFAAHPALVRYGWDEALADAFAPHADADSVPARILRVDRGGQCLAVTEAGTVRADTAPVAAADPTAAACTGDWAAVADGPTGPVVHALLPRRTAFLRSTSSKRSDGQVLAANADVALIAVSLAAELDLGRLERFVSLAWSSGARPLVVLTKTDLVPDPSHLYADAAGAAPGVQVLLASAVTGAGLPELAEALRARTGVLLGLSGAGKSTLVNALLGAEASVVQAIRGRDGKGRHTTTHRELFPLPAGGVLIDTPGLRGVGLWEADAGLDRTFTDIDALAGQCRFPDCGHGAEPGCAVLAALEDGTLAHRRLDSYRKLQRESERMAARTDARLRAERRKEFKRRDALGRHMAERKRGRLR
ncbi:ribosome small subunit-dependent GTPase A [Streptomyces sp. TRM 70351]|uniref:ribosome small subunit-dependent GTPase A n=1 Tax=Streptomyces sp. TRM 70351 TaxID=3116552 RepID=UPI002E7BAB5E|nr:ribosome small subunit-dependent GTPase A [Streptomyces sp. TRM 70351]MEE1926841.1 ribosome small subunit-dependent GTPase A [Streptomyces sp. TRM 70351]